MENNINDNMIEAFYMKEFSITLDSNPSTRYSWIPLFDNRFLELRDRSFKAISIKLGPKIKMVKF